MKINEEQRCAAKHIKGPTLILASAGTGKTTCLVHRLVEMIKRGIPQDQILCITFTNHASDVMTRRVREHIGQHEITICTFHSLCYRLLKSVLLDDKTSRNFTILDDKGKGKLVKEIIGDLGSKHYSGSDACELISIFKRALQTAAQVAVKYPNNEISPIFSEYQNRLEKSNVLDFDDLIFYVVAILTADDEKRSRLNHQYQYIMIDEFQDTNQAQLALSRLLVGKDNNICVVGDDSQSIYGFQGANLHNILDFESYFPGTKRFILRENYRSRQPILTAADNVIHHNTQRTDKSFKCTLGNGPDVVCRVTRNEYEEATEVAAKIQDLHDNHNTGYGEIAILYRSNWQSRYFETTLRAAHIPYTLVGNTGLYNRSIIRCLNAYLQFFVNPSSDVHLMQIINRPRRGIGHVTTAKLKKYVRTNDTTLWDAVKSLLPDHAATVLLSKYVGADHSNVYNLTLSLMEDTEYLGTTEDTGRDLIEDILDEMKNFRLRAGADTIGDQSLSAWLGISSLASTTDDIDEDDNSVSLMTIHASKGLEFKVVFLCGMEEGTFPHFRSIEDGDIEEERRLCYVAMTRAKEQLLLTRSVSRSIGGKCSIYPESRFIREFRKGKK